MEKGGLYSQISHWSSLEVLGTGLYHSEWRTQNSADLNALRLAAISNFKLSGSQLHARKRKEYAG